MRCQIGGFTWETNLDGECPNHGLRDRYGNARTQGAFCGEHGPEDRDGTPILGCCSLPVREYMDGIEPSGTCPCGKTDPGIKPGGGCWCTEDKAEARRAKTSQLDV